MHEEEENSERFCPEENGERERERGMAKWTRRQRRGTNHRNETEGKESVREKFRGTGRRTGSRQAKRGRKGKDEKGIEGYEEREERGRFFLF